MTLFILDTNNKTKDKITIKRYIQFAKKNTFSDDSNRLWSSLLIELVMANLVETFNIILIGKNCIFLSYSAQSF